MRIVDACIRRPVATTMFIAFLVVLGLISYGRLPVDLFPNVDFPIVTVTTSLTGASVEEYLANIADESRRKDCQALTKLMATVMNEKPRMWGPGIVGFGKYQYKYESGREGDWFKTGFSPRKNALTLYGLGVQSQPALMSKLGKFKTGKGCLYIRQLSDVDLGVLEKLIQQSAKQ